MKNIFDFSGISKEDQIRKYLTEKEINQNKGKVGCLKNELGEHTLLSTIILQKKMYANLCLVKNVEKNTYTLKDGIACKRLNGNILSFKNYIECLIYSKKITQIKNQFIAKKSRLHLTKSRIQGLTSYDNSNFLLDCNFCTTPIDDTKKHEICNKKECRLKYIYLKTLLQNFEMLKNAKYEYDLNGKLKLKKKINNQKYRPPFLFFLCLLLINDLITLISFFLLEYLFGFLLVRLVFLLLYTIVIVF